MGLPQLFVLPLLPLALKLFDSRLVIGFGLTLFGVSCGMNAWMSPSTGIDQLKTVQLVRAAGQRPSRPCGAAGPGETTAAGKVDRSARGGPHCCCCAPRRLHSLAADRRC